MDWDWGIWELEGVPQSVQFRPIAQITASDFGAIAAGATMYNLSGSGDAAAMVFEGPYARLVQGIASLSVQVGQAAQPNWNGDFSMSNIDGDSLVFQAGGLIQVDGLMTGSAASYNLNVNGTAYGIGTLTGQIIDGRLVGPGIGPTPITGATGSFNFNHGGAASAHGGFGVDLF